VIAVSITDSIAFEWATFYLRDHKTVIRSGALLYYLSPDSSQEPYASQIKNASLLVTDVAISSNEDLLWSNSQSIASLTQGCPRRRIHFVNASGSASRVLVAKLHAR
jgi:hypothetical protein